MEVNYDKLEKEGITKEILDAVDLSIAYSPVMYANKLTANVNYKTSGGNYYLYGENKPRKPEEIKIMRARYLINREQPEFVKNFFKGKQMRTIKLTDKKGMKELKNFTEDVRNFDSEKFEFENLIKKLSSL